MKPFLGITSLQSPKYYFCDLSIPHTQSSAIHPVSIRLSSVPHTIHSVTHGHITSDTLPRHLLSRSCVVTCLLVTIETCIACGGLMMDGMRLEDILWADTTHYLQTSPQGANLWADTTHYLQTSPKGPTCGQTLRTIYRPLPKGPTLYHLASFSIVSRTIHLMGG